jgi:CSLREA domain-containing protein
LPKPPRRLATLSASALLLLLTVACLLWGVPDLRRVRAASPLFAGFVVTNTNDAGAGSLRQAILDANANPGPDDITFNIPGAGVHTITPLSPLPVVNGTVNIDGYTQPGAVANSLGTGSNAVLLVELDGSAAGTPANGLEITGNTVSLSGLVINRFGGHGILFPLGAEGGVRGCYIGTNAAGTAALGNAGHGVAIFNSGSHTIGGTAAGESNLISGNGGDGVHIEENAAGADADVNVVQGNRIGLSSSSGGSLPNAGNGVYIFGDQNSVGGQNAGEGNQIANNGGDGVEIASGVTNSVRGNSIFSNVGLGIELRDAQPDGTVTPNDPGDGDTGPNGLQNFPSVTSATSSGNSTVITGTLDSSPASGFRLDFYSSPACDQSGNGEGQTHLGFTNINTDGSGLAPFNVTLPTASIVGHVVTATLTGEAPSTSEFSPCRVLASPVFNWKGSADADWHNGANWDTGVVPTASDIAVIPSAGVVNEPTISAADAAVASLTVQTGRTLSLTAGRTLTAGTTNVNSGGALNVPAAQTGTLAGTLTLDGTLTGGDAASAFRFNGPTLNNNGTINVALLRFGGSTQTLAGTGSAVSTKTSVLAGATVTLGSSHALGALTIDGGGRFSQGPSFDLSVGPLNVTQGGVFQNLGTGDLTLGGVSNDGTINLNGGGAACGDADSILLRSSAAGVQPSWSGAGTFSLADVDVRDQAGTAPVAVLSGSDSGNNGANWTFTVCPAGSTLTVNTTDDADDGACNAAHCSLREAILTSNSTPGQAEVIAFNIGGGGPQTISPTSALPPVADAVNINGTTQPGFNGAPLVELNGAGAGAVTAGLNITTSGSTVRGLLINRFGGHGIRVASSGLVTIAGNFIGTDATGTAVRANAGSGVFIDAASNNTVGGTTAADRNVISGNGGHGVRIDGVNASNNRVRGNFIGTDVSGTVALGNINSGVAVFGSNSNTVGGTAAAARNVISGNGGVGVLLSGGGAGANVVQGNYIGTQADGASALPNLLGGVSVSNGASGSSVGGTAAGTGNVIAFNGGDGVSVSSGTGNRVLSNSIHTNGSTAQHLGIDLEADGVTPNDAGDVDAGANNQQNFPLLTNAASNGATTNVNGVFNSTGSTAFRVEFFSSATCDPGGGGEGQQFLGSTDVTTDGNGNAAFNVTLPNVAVGQMVTATATDPSGNTSEFSTCRAVVAATYTLGGRVTNGGAQPLAGVNIHLSGSADLDATTDAAGNYTFTHLPQGGSFTLTPSATGFTFTPPSRTFNNLQSDQTGLDFTGQLNTYTIAGIVVDGNGAGLTGVNVHLSGSAVGDATTDAAGNYSFTNLQHGGSFTLTPSRTGYHFTPPSRTVGNLQGAQTGLDFTGQLNVYALSGRVTNEGAQPLVGINVRLSGSANGDTTTDASGNYSFTNLPHGGSFTLTPSEVSFRFDPPGRTFNNLQSDQTGLDFTGRVVTHTVTGTIVNGSGAGLSGVTVTLAGARSAVALTDASGNFTFAGVPAGGSFVLTPEKEGFSFNPPNRVIADIGADVRFDTVANVPPSPTPTPDQSDDFSGGPDPDPSKWAKGILTNPSSAFDPLVGVFLQGGLLHIQPRAGANGSSFSGLVSVRPIDLNSTPVVSVEVVQASEGDGAQTFFGLGADAENWARFVVQGESEPTATTTKRADNSSTAQTLLFQMSVGGDKFSASVTYDPAQHRFWRFRHDAPARLVIFETSPDSANWTERFRAQLPANQTALIAELSAGTSRASSNPSEALFDNFLISPSPRVQFETSAFAVRESGGTARVNVVRTGSDESPLSVNYATTGGTASAGSDYTHVSGTLLFHTGERLKSFNIPVLDDDLTEGGETVGVVLSNPVGGRLGSIPQAVVTILDDESENPINDTTFFVRQHYLDFLGREPDEDGLQFWVENIRRCASAQCREVQRVNTSAAFFLSIEFQGTGFFVQRLYRLSFGRAPLFAEYLPDLTVVREGVVVGRPGALDRLELNKRVFAEQFVRRAAFRARFDGLNEAQYVDTLAAGAGVTLGEEERTALVVGLLTHRETRGGVLLKMAEKDAFVRAEFNRAFVQMQYFGYLRRDPDAAGFNFWLNKLNSFNGDYVAAEMVKAFLSSNEYRARFGQP